MVEDILDVYDEENHPLGQKKKRSEVHKEGFWHRTVHVWIYNSKEELLLQLRSPEKGFCPNMWDVSSAGHVASGEEPLESVLREVGEELGLTIAEEDLSFWQVKKISVITNSRRDNEFCYIYFLIFNGDLEELKLQKEEVKEVKFLSLKKLKEELEENPEKYVPYRRYWEEIMDKIEKIFRP